jgi:hypothetical protein
MAIDFNKPVKGDHYDTGFLTAIRAHVLATAMWLDTAQAGAINNAVAGVKRYNAGTGLFEQHTGAGWAELNVGYLKKTAPTSYGSLQIGGSSNGWAGIQFVGSKLWTLMVSAAEGASGVHNTTDGAWLWYFNGSGQLAAGSVPWARIPDPPAITALTADSNATGNTVARRDGNGYLYAAYLNQGSGNSENPAVSQVLVTNGADNFLRKASLAHLGNSITVPWGNVSGRPTDLGSFTNGPGFITSAPLASYAQLNSGPSFTGRVFGNGGGSGLGKVLVQAGGTPPAMAAGDLCLIY